MVQLKLSTNEKNLRLLGHILTINLNIHFLREKHFNLKHKYTAT